MSMLTQGNCYEGRRESGDVLVTVNGQPLDLRLDLYSHSPAGFEYGYLGSGPAQLALAILAHEVTDQQALDHHQQFKQDVIANLSENEWKLSGRAIHDWLLTAIYQRAPVGDETQESSLSLL